MCENMEFISSVEHDSSRVSALICYINTIYSVTQTNKRNDFSQLYFKRTERKCRKRNKLLTTPFQGRFQKYSYKFQIVQIKFRKRANGFRYCNWNSENSK